MIEAVIVDAVRTPIGALGGSLAAVRPDDLAAHVIRALLARTGLDPSAVEEVYFGCANQAGEDNRNVARMAALLAGLAGGSGRGDLQPAVRLRPDSRQHGGPRHPRRGRRCFYRRRRGKHVARAVFPAQSGKRFSIWQPDRLRYRPGLALPQPADDRTIRHRMRWERRRRTLRNKPASRVKHRMPLPWKATGGRLPPSIPVNLPRKSSRCRCRRRKVTRCWWTKDERPRRDTSLESLARLRPAFRKNGTVTAGNSSG